MNNDPIIAQVIFAIVIITSGVGLIYVIKAFLFPKNKERETIHRSARSQSQLIGRRTKK